MPKRPRQQRLRLQVGRPWSVVPLGTIGVIAESQREGSTKTIRVNTGPTPRLICRTCQRTLSSRVMVRFCGCVVCAECQDAPCHDDSQCQLDVPVRRQVAPRTMLQAASLGDLGYTPLEDFLYNIEAYLLRWQIPYSWTPIISAVVIPDHVEQLHEALMFLREEEWYGDEDDLDHDYNLRAHGNYVLEHYEAEIREFFGLLATIQDGCKAAKRRKRDDSPDDPPDAAGSVCV